MTWWSRWFPSAGPVDDSLFQGTDDPYPGHWRRNPEPWPTEFTDEEPTRRQLRSALEELPASWRAVTFARDMEGRASAEVAAELGLTVDQEQQILNRARAALRTSLSALIRLSAQ